MAGEKLIQPDWRQRGGATRVWGACGDTRLLFPLFVGTKGVTAGGEEFLSGACEGRGGCENYAMGPAGCVEGESSPSREIIVSRGGGGGALSMRPLLPGRASLLRMLAADRRRRYIIEVWPSPHCRPHDEFCKIMGGKIMETTRMQFTSFNTAHSRLRFELRIIASGYE